MRTLRLSDLPFPCLWAPGNVTRLKNDDDEEEDGYESGSSDGDTETRDEDGEYGDIIISHSDGRHRGGVKIFRKNAPSLATQCTICHRTQEAKEKAKVKKRGLYDSSAASEKVRAGRKSYLPTILHP